MLNDVIHKMLFEVECREEDTARALQHTIRHYTWPIINKTIDTLLPEAGKEQHIIIDKIELQLGEMTLFELEGSGFAITFENNFRESLLAWSHKNQDKRIGERQTEKTSWEIIETFLLYGDLPWWVDKTEGIDVKDLLRQMIHSNPARVESFLASQQDNVARRRLWPLLTNPDRVRFSQWFNVSHNNYDVISPFSPDLIATMQGSFKPGMQQRKRELQKAAEVLSRKYRGQYRWKTVEKKLLQLIKKMEDTEVTALRTFRQAEVAARIETLLRKKGLLNQDFLRTFIKIWQLQQRRRKDLMQELMKNDRFFEFPFLKLVMQHPPVLQKKTHQDSDDLIAAWSRTAGILKKQLQAVRPREQMQYHNLLNYGASVVSERTLIKKLVSKLPVESLQLLTALANLNEESLQYIVESESSEPSVIGEKEIIVDNAGICLIAAYLPALFKKLGYIENSRFRTKSHAIRAIYLLHYIIHGKTGAPEYLLHLNKVLCGWSLFSSFPERKRWRKTELHEADELLRSIIQNWSALKNTSIGGLRTNFLQRKGILTENEQYWSLKVENKSIDVLLGSISWPFGMVKLPWMKKPLHIEW